jgi:hypothetical protein
MALKSNSPATVISPKKNVKNVMVLYDGGTGYGRYSVAKLKWNNKDVIGIRWNVSENEANHPDKISGLKVCLGEPNSHGNSTWFIVPDDLLNVLINGGKNEKETTLENELRKYLKEEKK